MVDGVNGFYEETNDIYCAYKPLRKVVGLMCWRNPFEGRGVVPVLTMLPGHESEGTFLVEYAVNLSEKAGYEGRTYFVQIKESGGRYDPPWFQYLQSANVVPRDEVDEWVDLDGVWRLRKNFRGRTTKSARNIHSPDL